MGPIILGCILLIVALLIRPYFAKVELFQVLQDMSLFKKARVFNLQRDEEKVVSDLANTEQLMGMEGAVTPDVQVKLQKMKEDLQRISEELAAGNTENLDASAELVSRIQGLLDQARINRVKEINEDDYLQEILVHIQNMRDIIQRRIKKDPVFVSSLSAQDNQILDAINNDPFFNTDPAIQLENRQLTKQQIKNGRLDPMSQDTLDGDEVKIFVAQQHLNLIVKRAASTV